MYRRTSRLYKRTKCILTEILSLGENDIDRDISLGENDSDRDISLGENEIDRDISLGENDIDTNISLAKKDIDREGQKQDNRKIKYFFHSQNLSLLLQRYPLFSRKC